MTEPQITITATVAEMNVILNALSGRPFAEVAVLLTRLQQDAQKQLTVAETPTP